MPPGNAVPRQSLGLTSILVREYDEAIAFYVKVHLASRLSKTRSFPNKASAGSWWLLQVRRNPASC